MGFFFQTVRDSVWSLFDWRLRSQWDAMLHYRGVTQVEIILCENI
jgi:hypothetical protein